MATARNQPEHVLRVTTYGELKRFADAFARGFLNLVILCGAAGLGKSRCFADAVGLQAFWIDGNASPFGIYMQAYLHRNQTIVLDDVDSLYADRSGVRLLKSLCQSDQTKTLSWQTDARTLDKREIPRQFTTSSRVAIIANQWQSLNADLAALEDRSHFLHFIPSALEVHRHAAEWFWNQEIFDFVADHLHLVEQPSLRVYVLAWEQKRAGLDWRGFVLSRCLKGKTLEVARLKHDSTFDTEEARCQAFIKAGLGCRATFFNHARKLARLVDIPRIPLRQSTQPSRR